MTDSVIRYLKDTYHPRAILLYGSYSRGDQDEYSDFDCMIIVDSKDRKHDDSVVASVQLDCFLFTAEETVSEDADVFLPAYDAKIVVDDGVGLALQNRVRQYVRKHETIEDDEKRFIRSWIRKTMRRAEKNDDEGNYRAVAFLWESLTDYCLLRDRFYFGSKQMIGWLKTNDPDGYALFHSAITNRTRDSIAAWAAHVIGK